MIRIMETREKRLIAVASTDGKIINQHFGHAERFLIYRAGCGDVKFLEERSVTKYCLGIETHAHPFEEDRFMGVVSIIKDCRFVMVSKVGPVPENRLKRLGVLPVMTYGPIEEAIRKALAMEALG